jgi:hypothetical protein
MLWGEHLFVISQQEHFDFSSFGSGVENLLEQARLLVRPMNAYFCGIVLYSVPTGLWAFSFSFGIVSIWLPKLRSFGAALFIGLIVSITISAELAQAAKLLEGRFDSMDLAADIIGILAGGILAYAKKYLRSPQVDC